MDAGLDHARLLEQQQQYQQQYPQQVASPQGPNPYGGLETPKTEKFSSKSLFFCLVLDNPFYEAPPARGAKIQFLKQNATEPGGPVAFMEDDDLLLVPHGNDVHRAPTKFEKVIEIILRLQNRGFHLQPANMIISSANAAQALLQDIPDNEFMGYSLNREALLTSPDGDEMYIKLHAGRPMLLKFAEIQGVVLNTHPYSFGGGSPLPYSKDQERKLDGSLKLFCEAFPELADIEDDEGNKLSLKPHGFILDVPDKMRLVTRLMREAWQFGGCGIQISEMKHRGVLVRHFFPLHNVHYQDAYGLGRWASLGQALTTHPFYQVEEHVVKYFGESVALYFVWIRKYTLFLRYIAFFGLAAGVLDVVAQSFSLRDKMGLSLINMSFSAICCIWGVAWICKWRRVENEFSVRYGQDAQVTQELVRDEFQQAELPRELAIQDLFRMNFSYPLTLRNRQDGAMMQLHDNARKRVFLRYFVSYPAILILSSGMVTLLYFTTYWRFKYPTDQTVSYASSVCTILIGFVFGVLFDKVVGVVNGLENNRTDTEMEEQTINKSFLFYFFSYYFALFTIALWPSDVSDETRLDQLSSQMLIITVVKPMVQNVTELCTPWFKSQLRIRTDIAGGSTMAGLCSLLRCEPLAEPGQFVSESEAEGRKLWLEAQMEPYESTSGDYLEITLQFGYMTMFAATFPWAAVAALLYNMLEIRIDARKILRECQRPVARPADSIGAWNGIFLFLAVLSVITNGYLIAIMSNAPNRMGLPIDDAARYKVFTVCQYILVFCFFIIFVWYAGNSEVYNKIRAKYQILANHSTRARLAERMRSSATTRASEPMA